MAYPTPDQYSDVLQHLATALLDPRALGQYFAAMLGPIACARPNGAHRAIAVLERQQGAATGTDCTEPPRTESPEDPS